MNSKSTLVGVAAVAVLAALIVAWWRWTSRNDAPEKRPGVGGSTLPVRPPKVVDPGTDRKRPPEPPAPKTLTAAEKAARIARIKGDYDEIRLKASADYSAAGANFPGGLNAFLKQLALLEREKRADFAAVLSPAELEDLELRETTAGQLVDRLLGPTPATDEQRRSVFRLQREHEDRFALTFDIKPRALLERETARQQMQQQIRAALGDDLFGAWLQGEGEDYAQIVAFAARLGLPSTVSLDLRQIKNDYTRQRLELNAAQGMTPDQLRAAQAALVQQTEARVIQVVGPGAAQSGRADILSWLPKR